MPFPRPGQQPGSLLGPSLAQARPWSCPGAAALGPEPLLAAPCQPWPCAPETGPGEGSAVDSLQAFSPKKTRKRLKQPLCALLVKPRLTCCWFVCWVTKTLENMETLRATKKNTRYRLISVSTELFWKKECYYLKKKIKTEYFFIAKPKGR